MHLARFRDSTTGEYGLAVSGHEHYAVELEGERVRGFSELLRLPLAEIRAAVEGPRSTIIVGDHDESLSPCDGRMEVWAAGVTYSRSRDARVEESTERSVYDRVYDADRPELFFKSAAWRTVSDGAAIGIRADSQLNVPEPELALMVNAHREIVGYTVCNDVSSRSIEGENPLYLPQAKIYKGSCSIASAVRPAWEVPDPYALEIQVAIVRHDAVVWQGQASTAQLHRTYCDLVDWLFKAQDFPDGVLLSTGTCLVPPMDITLRQGDEVQIKIADVGELSNRVSMEGTSATHELKG